ncbi:MAG: DinB family protein [Acidobacteria bacterium]|nr:DinB family protein [Acidobacteriota bacterium]
MKKSWGALLLAAALCLAQGCRQVKEATGLSVVPKSLRDVPAERLAFRFEPDVDAEKLPPNLRHDEPEEPAAAIRTAFETQRPEDALIRTVVDPSGMRALVLYGTSATDTDFRIDLYNTTGQFIRNVLPPDLTGVFPAEVAWSPDGAAILFSGVRTPTPQATPEPPGLAPAPPGLAPSPIPGVAPDAQPTPTAAPLIPSTQTFRTEQVYVGDRDGYGLHPVTAREGLIYFKLAWSPDGRAVAALACKEDEWEAQRREGNPHAGRPRIVTLEGQERLLDDRATPVEPVWSPDGSKVATAFEYDVAVYDAGGGRPTGAGLSLREPLRAASADYDARVFKKAEPAAKPAAQPQQPQPPSEAVLISLNPFVRLEWVEPETLYAQTAFVHIYHDEPVFKYPRWHVIHVSPQAAVLGRLRLPADERSDPPFMDFRSVPEIYEHIDRTRARLLAAVEGLSDGQQTYSPAPGRWSVAELVEHLSIVEGNVAGLLGRLLGKAEESAAAAPPPAPDLFNDPVSIEEFVERSRAVKLEAPERVRPAGLPLADSLARLKDSRAALHSLRPRVERADGRALRFPHPAWGPLDLYQWLLFVGAHEDRHLAQIEALKQTMK